MFGNKSQAQPTKTRKTEAENPLWLWLRVHRQGVLLSALIAGVGVIAWFAVFSLLDRPIARADISGKFAQVSRVQVQQALAPFARAGFVSIDLAAVKKSLEAISWIDRARVEREWPDTLRVVVTEQVAVARWNDLQSSTTGLLNTRGELFLPNARDLPADLPQLSGPQGTEGEVAKLYLETFPRLLTVGLRLDRVVLDERGAWTLQLGNGVEVRLGQQDVQARLERFISAASPVIATRNGEVAYVDMRYSNGFAIGWSSSSGGSTPRSTNKDSTNGNV
jgi:cell division protein FtsQ